MLQFVLPTIGVGLIVYAFVKWVSINHDFFAKRNLPFIKPTFILGVSGGLMLKLHRMDTWSKWLYNYYPKAKTVGMFDFRQPLYLLRDPALIKQVVVKDFDYFEDHKLFIDPTVDKLFGNSLIMLRGEKWRDMRANLSPAFTGSKMRLMFDMVSQCAVDMVGVLSAQTSASQAGGVIEADMKDLFGRCATDVVATSAFGIKVNSFTDRRNEFFVNGQRAMNFATMTAALKLVMMKVCPAAMRWMDMQFIDSQASAFFRSMALDTIRTRLEKKIYRPDMINILMQLKTNNNVGGTEDDVAGGSDSAGFATVEESHIGKRRVDRKWSDTDLAAQCFLFFAAGFDTTSTLLTFLTYELALNQDVQQRLYRECCETRSKLKPGTALTYDTLQHMEYLDQVVCETLRLWPPVPLIDRMCVRDYSYDDGELRFDVKKSMSLWIPVYGLHRDEQYFPEPDRFKPERFSDEQKDSIVPGSYLPFGVGPRNCIGSRFALMEVKSIVYHILLEFELLPTAATPIPMRLAAAGGFVKSERDVVLALKKR